MRLKALLSITLLLWLQACDQPVHPTTTSATAPIVLVVDIDGMHCTACAASIASTLSDCEGVQSADVSFSDAQATITADDATSLEQAVQTARSMGYTVEPAKPDEL